MYYDIDEQDNNIVFLLKTTKKKYAKRLLEGELCFNFPNVFKPSDNNVCSNDKFDKYDSHCFYNVKNLVIAQLIEDSKEKIVYEQPIKVSSQATLFETNGYCQSTPLTCFRMIERQDFILRDTDHGTDYIFRLGNLVDKIKTGFDHDSFVLIADVEEFFNRLSKQTSFFRSRVYYGDKNVNYEMFVKKYNFEQNKMFQKREQFKWQKEYRVILPPRKGEGPQKIKMDSIEDIAFCGNLKSLRLGYAFHYKNQ